MSLSVKVISYKRQPPVSPMSMPFNREGGTIGRLPEPENKFHLPDPDRYISRKHAVIRYENGFYYLTDTSTAGTFVTNRNLKVHRDSIQLTDGDRLKIGDYELIVSITDSGVFDTPSFQADTREDDSSLFNFGPDSRFTDDAGVGEIRADDKPFKWGQENISDSHSKPVQTKEPIEGSPLDESFVPPDILPPKPRREIPPDFDFRGLIDDTDQKGNDFPEFNATDEDTPKGQDEQWFPNGELNKPHLSGAVDPSPRQRIGKTEGKVPAEKSAERSTRDISKTHRPRPRDAVDDLLDVFFKAAGIEDTSFISGEEYTDLVRTLGAIFRELIAGLMTILRGRTELKTQIRVPVTILRPADNNPLKFSPGVDEALKLLLAKNHPGFVDAVEAVREGYQDIMHHQLAITAGVQASLMNVLKRFDPHQFENKYQEGIVIQKRARCWDSYSQAYREIKKDALEDFFGEAFARAYEDQLLKLRTTRTKD
jgi:type VI secretion system protein